MRWPTAEFQKRRVETYEIIIRLSTRGRDKCHVRLSRAGLVNNVFFERKIIGVSIKSAAADGDDQSWFVGHSFFITQRKVSILNATIKIEYVRRRMQRRYHPKLSPIM